jgi:hypothetical protein
MIFRFSTQIIVKIDREKHDLVGSLIFLIIALNGLNALMSFINIVRCSID